jgi:pyruvate formate lyase activating enzyme
MLPYIDAMAVDLKSFRDDFYREAGGSLAPVLDTIQAAHKAGVHVEVVTLIITGINDTDEEMDELSGWLGSVNENIPLHLTRFYPRYLYKGKQPTSRDVTERLAVRAGRNLKRVFV